MELPVWKQEPASPPSDGLAAVWLPLDDDTFYRDEFDVKFEGDLLACETKAEVASQILENLESLVDLDELIKEEPCFLLDEKMLPMLNEVEAPRAVPVKPEFVPGKTQTYTIGDFETVYDAVGLGLTPPQSPPAEGHVLASLEPQRTIIAPQQPVYTDITNSKAIYSVPDRQLAFGDVISYQQQQPVVITVPPPTTPNYRNVGTPQPDIAHELAIVDELLRTRVKDLQWNSETSGPSSPESSSNSNFGDCSSSSEDPEWAPEPHDPSGPLKGSSSIKRARHSKPYSRAPTEDKKSRKKEQNKNAATRYRLKKKAEAEEILTEERKLQDINTDLGAKITDLNREIKYLKGLMRDLFKAKGLID